MTRKAPHAVSTQPEAAPGTGSIVIRNTLRSLEPPLRQQAPDESASVMAMLFWASFRTAAEKTLHLPSTVVTSI